MAYLVKELFLTLQGEGINAGRPAVFCRFAGCNLWSGQERHRASAVCRFCDTDFVGTDGPGGGRFASADELADAVVAAWPGRPGPAIAPGRWWCARAASRCSSSTAALIDALHRRGAPRWPSRPTAPCPCPPASTGCA